MNKTSTFSALNPANEQVLEGQFPEHQQSDVDFAANAAAESEVAPRTKVRTGKRTQLSRFVQVAKVGTQATMA